MPVYRPRMACVLQLPDVEGGRTSVSTLPIKVRRATVDYNDHNHADQLTLSVAWRDAGIDPRLLKNATCEFYLGNANEYGEYVPDTLDLRFMGVMDAPRRSAKEGGGLEVELTFRDYTAFFLSQKPLPSKGIPLYSDTLIAAWQRICDATGPMGDDGSVLSSVEVLRGSLECRGGVTRDLQLSKAVAARFAKGGGPIATKPQSDAWAVWQQVVGMMGLVSFIDRDVCVVTTSTEHYSDERAPQFIWGKNILELEESAHSQFSDKGVAITAFDPISGTTMEAFYPAPGDKRIVRKKPPASKKKAKAPQFPSERYEYFEYWGVTDQATLDGIAQRAWEERSRQELEGRLRTVEMYVDGVDNSQVDLLALRTGDGIRVVIDPQDKDVLASVGSNSEQVAYLEARGYSTDIANFLVRNMAALERLDPTFHVKTLRASLEVDGDSGSFDIDIGFHNRIDIRVQ